ncbi:Flp family type IVb pilin [Ruegeria marina]|uniref:Flp/Fap pilin component n=1 Tax=Ruegeria marina TaxID=639004 RepID=A0A1G7F977_9RHOB|nr:Flp family type IVb pilin [Ruegeria marina]SDE72503.1 Flp/Fap pilin component [Ruegeria marina]
MQKILDLMIRLTRDEKGATIVEYGVALTIVTAIAVATLTNIGTDVAAQFTAADALM